MKHPAPNKPPVGKLSQQVCFQEGCGDGGEDREATSLKELIRCGDSEAVTPILHACQEALYIPVDGWNLVEPS